MNPIKNRESNIECLRIVSMFLIVLMHLLWHGGVLAECSYGSVSYYLFWSIRAICYISVNSFVLISGYFMVYSHFSVSKLFRIVLQTLFYSLVMYAISSYLNHQILSIPNIIKVMTPVSSGIYWYITTYVLMCIMSPVLNIAMEHMNRKSHLAVTISLVIFYCIIPTFFFWTRDTLSMGRDLTWFITLYFVAAFIRKYDIRYDNKLLVLWLFYSVLLMILSLVAIGSLTHSVLGVVKEQDLMFCFNSLFSFVASVSAFMLFLNFDFHSNRMSRAINAISALVLGVYLLHENPFIRPLLWGFLQPARFMNQDYGTVRTLLYSFALCIMIMVIGCVFEKVRISLYILLGLPAIAFRIEEKTHQLLSLADEMANNNCYVDKEI